MSSITQVGRSLTFRVISISLIICLLSSSTPAAPTTIVSVTKQWSADLTFWYKTAGLDLLAQVFRPKEAKRQEAQHERDARVVRIKIFPGDVTLNPDELVDLSAVPYDNTGAPVGGVTFKWTATEQVSGRRAPISTQGEFRAIVQGVYKITAEGAGRTATTIIHVNDGPRRPKATDKGISVQGVDNAVPPGHAALIPPRPSRSIARSRAAREKSATFAHTRAVTSAPLPLPLDDGWNSDNYWYSHDPSDGLGDPPGHPADGGAGSGNFQFVAPIYERAGRGLKINLAASYNSRLWNKTSTQITYDIDRGSPAPGWSLGLGKMLSMGPSGGVMLVEADGTRHNYTGTITNYGSGYYGFVLHTNDGSFIDYSGSMWNSGTNISGKATLANGTVISYYSYGTGAAYPTFIEDANGNYITITYVGGSSDRIQTITDTLGRVITFNYDSNNLLTAITGPGLGGGTRTLATFHYHQLSLSYSFSGLTPVVRNYSPWVIDAIYYPATNTGYWFNDSDSYSSYGMIRKVSERRNMSFTCPTPVPPDQGTTAQCTINSSGTVTREQLYNYPAYVNDPDSNNTPSSYLGDAPTYSKLTESWTRDGTSTMDQAVTLYDVHEGASPRTIEITFPNGTRSKQYSYNSPGTYLDGLVYLDETRDSSGTLLQSSTSSWDPGDYGTPRPSQVLRTNNVINQTTKTTFTYGSAYNQVTDVRNYGYSNELLRSTQTTYQNNSLYTGGCNQYGCWGRHIFNLPLSVEIYDGNSNRIARTEYQYDNQTMTQRADVTHHDYAFDPYADAEGLCYWDNDWNDPDCNGSCMPNCPDCIQPPGCDGWCPQVYVCPYDSSTDYRGNVTQITKYANVDNSSYSGAVSETKRYDIAGNLVTDVTGCCEQTSINYTVDTQYAYPLSKTRGSATDPYAQVTTSSTYDFNNGLALSATDANGRQSTSSYNTNTLRLTSVASPTGAHTDYAYDDNAMSVTTTGYVAAAEGGGIANKNVKVLNGQGLIRQEQALGANSVWDYVDTTYDNMRQVSQQTRPYRSGDTVQSITNTYDALGRVKTVTLPDGSVTQSFYDESTRPSAASSTAGETTRTQDAWGRETWQRTDASSRLVEVVEPDPNGSGSVATNGMVTTYSYNTLGNLSQTVQDTQTRSFKYDALGRLLAQKLAEASATLNDAGSYVGSGTWSDVFTYDDRSNLTSRTDARGVKTVYTYNNDPLDRLQSVSFDTSGFGDTGNPILAAATVSYAYRTKSTGSQLIDVTQQASVSAAGTSAVSYSYDSEGRISSKTLTLTSRSSYPFVTDYTYDSLDRAKDVRYPAEYGNGSAPRKVVHQDFDVASRLSGVTFDSQSLASSINYNAASQTTSLNAGTGTNQVAENYSYNAQTGLLDGQTAIRNGATLLNLGYDYAGANTKRTGQLVKISNILDHNKDRGYEYDALGRLRRATGGQNVNWAQRYEYDRFGNRNNAYSYTADSYIRNFYQNGLNRQPTSTELNTWLSTLQTAYTQGQSQFLAAMQSLGQSIFNSQEYANRNRTDHWFVYDLYKTYLYREPDTSGWAFWESQVPVNGRANTRFAFDYCPEFSYKAAGTSPYSPPSGTVAADGMQQIAYDTSNHITNSGWSYDAAGNQAKVQNGAGWQRFQYDAANRLVKIKADDNVTVLATYTYGDSNERLIAEDSGTRTYVNYNGGAAIAEFTESGASTTPLWSKSYVYLGTRLLSTLTPSGGSEVVQLQHPDRFGTRLVTTPSNGTSFEQVTLPFGTALGAESTGATNRRFGSYDRNETRNLDYALNRHYDPQQGRFTQVDPLGMKSTNLYNPQTLNLYAYCANDPINRSDPSGLGFFSFLKKLFKWIAVAFTVALAVVTIIVVPYLAANILQAVFLVIGAVTGAAASVANALGLTKLGGILGVISAIATFGASTISAALDASWKTILKAISDGASAVSKTLTAFGREKLGQIFDLISSATGFASDRIDDDSSRLEKAWEIYKFARDTTQKVAEIAGADRLATFLNKAGVIDDAVDIYLGIRRFNNKKFHEREDLGKEVEKFGVVVSASDRIRRLLRLQSRLDTLNDLVGKVNSSFDRFSPETAPAQ